MFCSNQKPQKVEDKPTLYDGVFIVAHVTKSNVQCISSGDAPRQDIQQKNKLCRRLL